MIFAFISNTFRFETTNKNRYRFPETSKKLGPFGSKSSNHFLVQQVPTTAPQLGTATMGPTGPTATMAPNGAIPTMTYQTSMAPVYSKTMAPGAPNPSMLQIKQVGRRKPFGTLWPSRLVWNFRSVDLHILWPHLFDHCRCPRPASTVVRPAKAETILFFWVDRIKYRNKPSHFNQGDWSKQKIIGELLFLNILQNKNMRWRIRWVNKKTVKIFPWKNTRNDFCQLAGDVRNTHHPCAQWVLHQFQGPWFRLRNS